MNRVKFLIILSWVLFSGFLSASPAAPPAESQASDEKIRVLIVDGFSNHDWKKTTTLLRGFIEADGRFTVATSTSPPKKDAPGWGQWRPAFSDYDVVIQNCNDIGGGPSWPRAVEEDLEDFVRSGGGLFAFHSANNAFPKWKEYNSMIGLGWRPKGFGPAITISDGGEVIRVPAGEGRGTSHGKRVDARVTRLGEHPIHQGLPKQWTAADIEVYSYARGPAENLTVLSYARDAKTELNFPVEWVVTYGKGRVYNSTLGHVWKDSPAAPPSVRCVAFQTLLIRALEWLATGKTRSPVPGNFPDATKG